jgi:hypothetical protein
VGWVDLPTPNSYLPTPISHLLMNLPQQVQSLINGAPDLESKLSVAAIAPILQQAAQSLPSLAYYIRQSSQGEWAATVLRHRQQPDLEIRVIYAFTSLEDMSKFGDRQSEPDVAVEIPVIYLLFEMLAMPEIDRVIFLNNSQNLDSGQAITRSELEESIARDLDQRANPSSLPPDVC